MKREDGNKGVTKYDIDFLLCFFPLIKEKYEWVDLLLWVKVLTEQKYINEYT